MGAVPEASEAPGDRLTGKALIARVEYVLSMVLVSQGLFAEPLPHYQKAPLPFGGTCRGRSLQPLIVLLVNKIGRLQFHGFGGGGPGLICFAVDIERPAEQVVAGGGSLGFNQALT